MELEALDHVAVIVRDLPGATRFYEEVLGLHRVHEQAWGEYPARPVTADRRDSPKPPSQAEDRQSLGLSHGAALHILLGAL